MAQYFEISQDAATMAEIFGQVTESLLHNMMSSCKIPKIYLEDLMNSNIISEIESLLFAGYSGLTNMFIAGMEH